MRKLITPGVLCRLSVVALLALFATLSQAQDSASLTGVVSDSTGAVIPGVVVTLTNPSTGAKFTEKTDGFGSYRFTNIPPNSGYKETFVHDGFNSVEISSITLAVGIARTENAKMDLGKNIETVQVSAGNESVTLNTTDASVGNNMDVQQLNQLPVYDRSTGINTLFVQQPGVDSFQGAVTGARVDQSAVSVDGLDVDDLATGQTFYLTAPAPVDSIGQFTGTVAGIGTGSGTGSGGQFSLVTKSGTNSFHGNVNEYHRDTTTVANTWFNNLNGLRRTPLIRNQFGASLGGPVKRDKLFFFFDWADSRIVQSSTAERTVPLPDFRAGGLDYINNGEGCDDSVRITNLSSLPACVTHLTPAQVQSLDPAKIGFDAAELSFINSRYPNGPYDLSRGDGINTAGLRFTVPTPDTRHTYVGKVDYNLTETQRLSGRFTITRRDAISVLPEFPTDPVTHPLFDRSYSYVLGHTWNIGSNKVNQAYYGDTVSKLSFPDLYNPTGENQYSFSGIDGPYTDYDGQKRRIPIPIVRDDFTWIRGSHSMTMGGTFKFIKTNSNLVSDFNFVSAGLEGPALSSGLEDSVRPGDIYNNPDTQVSINDYDTMFAAGLGVVGSITTNFSYNNKGAALAPGSGSPRAYRFYQTEAYFGDTWKVNRNLTLDYGVRYQLYTVPWEVHGDESVPTQIPLNTYIKDRLAQQKAGDTSSTGLPIYSFKLGGKANHGANLYDPSYKDFAPRIGFAYTPYSDGKTVIQGSAGILYDRTVIDAINFLQDQISYLFFNSNTNNFGDQAGPAASLASDARLGSNLAYSGSLNPSPSPITSPYTPYVDDEGNPYGLELGETNFVIPQNLKDPYSIALTFGIQQELPGHTILKVNYVGRLARRLLADADAAQVIDVPDYTGGSTQSMAGAFAGLTKDLREGKSYTEVTAEPWFEDVGVRRPKPNGLSNTAVVAYYAGQYARRGDMSDAIYVMNAVYGVNGFFPTNIGIPAQFGANAYLTNMGNSNYHGLLLTVDKNMSQGLRAEFNYTWSHSIDNTSVAANENSLFTNSNFICDILYPRACRGDSDFDIRQEISSNFEYELPFGHGRMLAASSPRVLDEIIGGWNLSGLMAYRTGLPMSAQSDAYMASFDNAAPAIFTGPSRGALKTKINVDHSSNVVYSFAGGTAGAQNILNQFRGPIGIEYGQRNLLRGPGAFYLDAGLGKTFPILEDKVSLIFRADAFNVLNHPNFATSDLNIVTNASNFGQITGTAATPSSAGFVVDGARVAQFSLRLDF